MLPFDVIVVVIHSLSSFRLWRLVFVFFFGWMKVKLSTLVSLCHDATFPTICNLWYKLAGYRPSAFDTKINSSLSTFILHTNKTIKTIWCCIHDVWWKNNSFFLRRLDATKKKSISFCTYYINFVVKVFVLVCLFNKPNKELLFEL